MPDNDLRPLRDELHSLMAKFQSKTSDPSIRVVSRFTAEALGEALMELDQWMGWDEEWVDGECSGSG